MIQRRGQIARWQALLALLAVMGLVTGIVRLMDVLLPPQDPATVRLAEQLAQEQQGSALEEPQPGVPECPAPGDAPVQVTSTLLYECPRLYDGQEVIFSGEVVGEVLQRDDHAWVQLNDDAYGTSLGPLPSHGVAAGANSGVAVAIPLEAARRIENVGAHERQGDVLTVRGTYRRIDPDDGGATTIRAEEVLKIERGGPVEARRHPGRRLAALILLAVTIVLVPLGFRQEVLAALEYFGWFARLRSWLTRDTASTGGS